MQRDSYMHRRISERGAPAFPLPASITVDEAYFIGRGVYRWNRANYTGVGSMCAAMAQASTASHVQVYDATAGARVPMTFMQIADTARRFGQAEKSATGSAPIPAPISEARANA